MNEEKRIHKPLEKYTKTFRDCEIIVVSNGSGDGTCDVVRSFQKKHKNIRLLAFPKPLGKGGAVIEGLKKAKGEIIGFVDSDDAYEIEGIKRLLASVMNGECDCAIASKWKGKKFGEVTENAKRKIMSRGWNLLVRVFIGLQYHDTQSGAKFFTKKCYDSIDKKFICRGFEFDVELIYKIKKHGFRIKEIFVQSTEERGSKFNTKYIPEMFRNLVRLSLNRL